MKKILINEEAWQTRIAVTQDSKLQNVYFSSHMTESLERAFYKGTVTKVLPGIQTAFVDIGQAKAGFLHISEIDKELAMNKLHAQSQFEEEESAQKPENFRQRTDISNIFKEGDQILVQVSKEPVYEKGAKLSTCFILPGRFVVLMPNIPRIGVSKKIGNTEERKFLKEFVQKNLPEGMGAIIRTTAEGHNESAIIKDINILIGTWNSVQKKFKESSPGDRIHEDIDLQLQIVRDHLDIDVEAVIVDNKESHQKLYNFVKTIAPEHTQTIQHYTDSINLFEMYNIDKQIEQALDKKVALKSGGSLIIESTEAMTVIDVNTGKFVGKKNLEETIFKTNFEAAEEVVRQLRLRNIGGLIVIDFIDMETAANRRKLFQHFEKTLKERDKFQSVVLQLSEFGLVQMTRKRSGKTLVQQLTNNCPQCTGLGFVKSTKTEAHTILQKLKQLLASKTTHKEVALHVNPAILDHIVTYEYNAVLNLEKQFHVKITFNKEDEFQAWEHKIKTK